jgi:hypothetical protein
MWLVFSMSAWLCAAPPAVAQTPELVTLWMALVVMGTLAAMSTRDFIRLFKADR